MHLLPVLLFYGLWAAGFIVLLVLSWVVYDKRYKSRDGGNASKPSNGFVETTEVFLDPKDGLRYRVYYNPRTGDREYVLEK
ncbi:HD family phosphohydrolase [Paenibacillus athensensis]|nr:HD family phosphohydrolase [Paenibacillus athensensis]